MTEKDDRFVSTDNLVVDCPRCDYYQALSARLAMLALSGEEIGLETLSYLVRTNKEVLVDIHRKFIALDTCDHEWVSADNEVVFGGEICTKCYAVRPVTGACPCSSCGHLLRKEEYRYVCTHCGTCHDPSYVDHYNYKHYGTVSSEEQERDENV